MGRLRGLGKEEDLKVAIAEAVDGVFSGEHSSEQGAIGISHGIELGVALSVDDTGPAQVVELGDGLALNWRGSQCVEIAKVRALADL